MSREARLALHVRKERRKVEKELVRGGRLGGVPKGTTRRAHGRGRKDGRTDDEDEKNGRSQHRPRTHAGHEAEDGTEHARPLAPPPPPPLSYFWA